MLDAAAESGDPESYVQGLIERGERLMGFGHRVYRAEDPRARLLKGTAKELGAPRYDVADKLEAAALEALRKKSPDRPLETNVEFWSAVVLDVAGIPPELAPAMFACSRTAGWSAHILEQKKLSRLVRPSARYVGPGARPASSIAMTLAEAAARADELAAAGDQKALATLRQEWDEELEHAARSADYRDPRAGLPRDRAVPLPPEARARPARAAGREPGRARLGADRARGALARPSRRRQLDAGAAARARDATTRTSRCAGSAIVCLKNGSPQRETILVLNGLADDDEQDGELRKTAKAVATALHEARQHEVTRRSSA